MLSIVIVTHNRARELRKAIESCILNLDVDKEFIIIDNNSSDDTRKVVRYISKIHCDTHFTYMLNQSNVGVSKGRNQGYLLAQRKYVLFCVRPRFFSE